MKPSMANSMANRACTIVDYRRFVRNSFILLVAVGFTVRLPKIPGTDIEIGFIEYDEGAFKKFSPYMVPNSTDVGITGVETCLILSSDTEAA